MQPSKDDRARLAAKLAAKEADIERTLRELQGFASLSLGAVAAAPSAADAQARR